MIMSDVKRVDSVLISGACKLEKERLGLKFLRFEGGCFFFFLLIIENS